jgi:drug/metabolite transporter (DMT)-like permease
VLAAAGAAIFLGEEIVPLQVVGGLITIVSVIAVVRRRQVPIPDVVPEGVP